MELKILLIDYALLSSQLLEQCACFIFRIHPRRSVTYQNEQTHHFMCWTAENAVEIEHT